ncbi:MAG: hypothetical protein LBN71_00220 [Tannerella sp.]|jgi:hypothetical protein|nr:hypothetical protein [Tannerella sp.]
MGVFLSNLSDYRANPACGLPDDMPWISVRPGHADERRGAISETLRMKIP